MMHVTGGAVDVTTYFVLRLAADGTELTGATVTNFDLQYVRSGAAPAAKVDATALAATDSAHADNKAIEIDATDQPGLYRVDWPDAAFAAGAREVILTLKYTTAFTEHLRVQIDSFGAPAGASLAADVAAVKVDTAAVKTKTDFLPSATAGAAGGLFIAGSNAATTTVSLTTGAIAATTITASGAVAFQSTFSVTTSTALAALSCTTLTASGAVAFQSTFAVTTSTSLAALSCTTLTASGAVALQSTVTVSGATTLTGLTTGALACTTITASGAVAFQSTFAVTTSTALAALSCTTLTASGAVAFQSTFAVTTSTALAALSCTTLTASGAVAFQSTFAVTTSTSLAALSCTTLTASGAVAFQSTFIVTGATTFTGAITATNASNNLTLGTLTVTTNAIAWSAAWDAEVQSECADAITAAGFTFTIANVLDANIQRVNDVAVTGTGAVGDEWGP